jgi:hypothetical protein
VVFVGEVYRPEDIVRGKKRSSDLAPNLNEIPSTAMQNVMNEVRLLRAEVNKIKHVLRTNGITID